jgi:hypothetical protein
MPSCSQTLALDIPVVNNDKAASDLFMAVASKKKRYSMLALKLLFSD